MTNKPLAIVSSLLFSVGVLPAATNITLVQWGESGGATDIVTTTTSDLGTNTTETTFTPGDVDSPSSGYYPNNSGRNPDFNVAGTSAATWSIKVEDNASGDTITFSAVDDDSNDSIVIWENFTPMTAVLDYTFSLDSAKSGSIEVTEYNFVMQDGAGDWYIQSSGTWWGNDSTINASDITWHDYTPYSGGSDSIGDEPKSPTIAGAQAFGYRQELTFGFNPTHDVSYFQVMAVVPEPSSTALLGLGGLAMALRRKRG